VLVASPYAVFRAADFAWPQPPCARDPEPTAAPWSLPLAPHASRARRRAPSVGVVQGELFAGLGA